MGNIWELKEFALKFTKSMDFKHFYTQEIEHISKSLQKNIELFTNRGTPLHKIDLSFETLGDLYQKLINENSVLNEMGSTYAAPRDGTNIIDNTANQSLQKSADVTAVYEETQNDKVENFQS